MDGFWASFLRWFNEKTSSSLYFTYIAFFIVWNWKFFQIIFLESNTLFFAPRIEYIDRELLFHWWVYSGVPYWLHWLAFSVNLIANFAWHIMPPIAMTYLAILYLPKLHKWALAKDLENRFERQRMFQSKKREYDEWLLDQAQKESRTLIDLASEKEQQAKAEKKIQETMSDVERWGLEYGIFEKTAHFYKFRDILITVYQFNGLIQVDGVIHADTGTLAMADIWELVSRARGSNVIELTKKGRAFAKLYLDQYSILET